MMGLKGGKYSLGVRKGEMMKINGAMITALVDLYGAVK